MKQSIVCVFAHPDDEAFGPGGTIAKFSQTHDVTILCATKGEAGAKRGEKNIGKIRSAELRKSARILGVKQVVFLGFKDGTLCNANYHNLAKKIQEVVEKIRPVKLLTYEPRGVSGHIDHIVVSMVTSYVFKHQSYTKELLYFCNTDAHVKQIKTFMKDYFVYFPPGYKKSDIDLTVDTSSVWKLKEEAARQHKSQIHDVKRIQTFLRLMPKKEYFLLLKK